MADTAFFENRGPFTLQQIAEICGAELSDASQAQVSIANIATLESAGAEDICFFYDKKAKAKGAEIKAKACVTTEELKGFVADGVVILISANPKMAFLKLNMAFYSEYQRRPDVSSSARIAPSVRLGQNCYIGEHVVLEENVVVGDNCVIEHGAVVSRGCKIGNNCRIGTNAQIAYCYMGNDCYVYSGARVGLDGFGFQMVDGQHKRIPQIGRVIIGNDVEIGANACIDRGAMDDTVIGDGCRIDNMVQVAHNIRLGRGCVLVAQTGIAGSCTFGDYVVCGGQTGFADHLTVGSGAQIAAQSGIMRDIAPGAVVMGTPAVPIKDFMRQVAFLQKNGQK